MENFQQTTCLPLLRSSYNGLTKSEQKLADYILKNPADVMHMTMSELADATSSADATVFRFCHKLGFSGFQGLKQALAGDLFSPAESLSQEVNADDTPRDITRKVFQDMIDALQETQKMLDYKALEQAKRQHRPGHCPPVYAVRAGRACLQRSPSADRVGVPLKTGGRGDCHFPHGGQH